MDVFTISYNMDNESTDMDENVAELGISKYMEKHLERYFAQHKGQNVHSGLYEMIIKEIDKSVLMVTLKHCNWNQLRAAEILGINRNTLRNKIVKLQLSKNES